MIPSRRAGVRAAHALTATVIAGVLTYVVLALVSRTVEDGAFDQFSVFWSISLIVGFGFFLPVEQEAARLSRDSSVGTALLPTMMRATLTVGIGVVIIGCLSLPLLSGVLGLSPALAAACVAMVVASAVQFAARGRMLATSRDTAFVNLLILDTVLRVALLGAVALAAVLIPLVDADAWYAFALIAAIVGAHAWAVPWRSWAPQNPAVVAAFRKAVVLLVATSLCAQILVNAGPIVIQALEPSTGSAGAFQASSTLARVPLAMITPVQAMLVGPLAALAIAGDVDAIAATMRRVAIAAIGLALVGGAAALFIGPWLVDFIFGAGRALPGPDLALLVVGVIVHVALIVFTQAVIGAGQHISALMAWVIALGGGILVFIVALASAGPVLAVELGFGVGSAAGAVVAYVALIRRAHIAAQRREH